MTCKASRLTYDGKRYEVSSDGTVRQILSTQTGTSPEGKPMVARVYGQPEEREFARLVIADAARQRRNRNARAKHEALTGLGLVRVRGALGGVYYE
jgi:phosphopantetheinyl transferase